MTEEEKLLPCPVCGKVPDGIVDATKFLGVYRIVHRCNVWGPFVIEAQSPQRVAKIWNTRAPETAK